MYPTRSREAYKSSKNIYDTVLTQGDFLSRLYINFFWSGTNDNEIAGKILDYVPEDFHGKLLDVPVGTAVFTKDKWRRLDKADIVCLDYSEDMLEQAKQRLGDCKHISFVQGDVAALPLKDASCDIVMSMNGFHAFPNKEKAYEENSPCPEKGRFVYRLFLHQRKALGVDGLAGQSYPFQKVWFTPPFESLKDVLSALHKLYKEVDCHTDGSMIYFKCVEVIQMWYFTELNEYFSGLNMRPFLEVGAITNKR